MLVFNRGASRRWVVVCLGLATVASISFAARSDRARAMLGDPAPMLADVDSRAVVADATAPEANHPPRFEALHEATLVATNVGSTRIVPPTTNDRAHASTITFLHGACMSTTDTCRRLDALSSDDAWLVCPSGNSTCGGDASDWSGDGDEKADFLDDAVGEALDSIDLPRADTRRTDVLMGFSRGAFVARDVAYARPGRYRGLVLIGAATVPDAELLRKNGIRRVVLSSGDYDGSRKTMVVALTKLCAAGIPTRWVSLGKVWHALPVDSPGRLRDALEWVREDGDAGSLACKAPPPVRVPGA